MKTISGTIVLGILMTLAVVWYLGDLGHGAVALVTILCVGIAGIVVKAASWLLERGTRQ